MVVGKKSSRSDSKLKSCRTFKFAEKDFLLLNSLRKDARSSLTLLSRQTRIPVSTLFDRLKLLEKENIIKHTSLIDFRKIGYSTKIHYFFKVLPEERKLLKAYLEEFPAINNVYEITGDFHIMAEGIFKDILESEKFRSAIEEKFRNIEYKSHVVVKDLKKEGFIAM